MGNAVGRDVCCGVGSTAKSATTDPAFLKKSAAVPKVLEDFLEARRVGNVDAAAACCTDDMTMRGPMGEFSGLDIVRSKAFSKPSQPLGKTLMLLQYVPHLSKPNEAVYAREFEAQIGYAQVPLRQEVRTRARSCAGPPPPHVSATSIFFPFHRAHDSSGAAADDELCVCVCVCSRYLCARSSLCATRALTT